MTRWPIALLACLVLIPAPSAGAQVVDGTRMTHAAGERAGVVICAPHEGYEFGTGDIATEIARRTGAGRVIAHDFRDPDARRWINVNRPLENRYAGDERGDETETDRARAVYEEYQRRALEAAGARRPPIALHVEIHGTGRKVGSRTIQAIETATTGFDADALRRLKEAWRLGTAEADDVHRVGLYFDRLPEDRTYEFAGRTVEFYWGASQAKAHGALRPAMTRRALHFELPPELRRRDVRLETARLLADLVEAAIEEAE